MSERASGSTPRGPVRARMRAVGVLLAAAAAVAGLSACQSKVGQAAVVNGVRLSDTSLSAYVTRKAVPFTSNGQQIMPKVFALQTWIDTQLFEQAIAKRGGTLTEQERNNARAEVLGDTSPAAFAKPYTAKGFTTKLSDLITDERAMFVVLAQRLHPSQTAAQVLQSLQGSGGNDVIAEISKYAKNVSVSARYGSWDPKQLAVSGDAGAGLPSFVTFGTGATAGANQ